MKTRIISAIVALSIVLPGIVYGGNLGIQIIVFLASILAADEFMRMMAPSSKKLWPIFHLLNVCILASLVYRPTNNHEYLMISFSFIVLSTAVLFISKDNEKGTQLLVRSVFGLMYLSLFSFLIKIRINDVLGLNCLYFILATTWSADTGAYFAGRAFGNRKLYPRVSPNKTWAGAYGGFILSVLVALLMGYFVLPDIGFVHAGVLGALICFFSVVGDLVESMIKRAVNVKDSGWIMPGHGGILDRVDSLLFAAPVTWIYAVYVIGI